MRNQWLPDRFVLDLDPDPTLPWKSIAEAATLTRTLLDELGLRSFCKTSGGNGLHVVVPLKPERDWTGVKAFALDIARQLGRVIPQRFVSVSGPRNRVGKVFVDYLRNGRGATTVAAFSVRARPGLAVSVPVAWDEIDDLDGADQCSMAGVVARQRALASDPWRDYWCTAQLITEAMYRALGAT